MDNLVADVTSRHLPSQLEAIKKINESVSAIDSVFPGVASGIQSETSRAVHNLISDVFNKGSSVENIIVGLSELLGKVMDANSQFLPVEKAIAMAMSLGVSDPVVLNIVNDMARAECFLQIDTNIESEEKILEARVRELIEQGDCSGEQVGKIDEYTVAINACCPGCAEDVKSSVRSNVYRLIKREMIFHDGYDMFRNFESDNPEVLNNVRRTKKERLMKLLETVGSEKSFFSEVVDECVRSFKISDPEVLCFVKGTAKKLAEEFFIYLVNGSIDIVGSA